MRSVPTRLISTLVGLVIVLTACSDGDARPSGEAWRSTWDDRRAEVPTADEIIAGGSDLCGELVGRFRSDLSELHPTPDEALDDAVEAWIAHAETIVFECSGDRAELESQLATLDTLTAEVDAGLTATVNR